jgi:hypothetical protein
VAGANRANSGTLTGGHTAAKFILEVFFQEGSESDLLMSTIGVECHFLIPLRRDKEISDGKLHKPAAWKWIARELYKLSEAWTLAPGVYEGQWKSPETGEVVMDYSRRYIVALPRKKVAELRRLLVEACAVFQQRCIYLVVAGRAELVEVKNETA